MTQYAKEIQMPDGSVINLGGETRNVELINQIKLTEEVRIVTFNQDSLGNPLNLKDFTFIINARNKNNVTLQCNVVINGNLRFNSVTRVYGSETPLESNNFYSKIWSTNGNVQGSFAGGSASSLTQNFYTNCNKIITDEIISKLSIQALSSADKFLIGSEFYLYGVKI